MSLKNKIMLITAILFIITIGFYNFYMIYMKESFIKENIQKYNKQFEKTYSSIQINIQNTLSKRLKTIAYRLQSKTIQEHLNNSLSYEKAFENIYHVFKKLNHEMPHIKTLHIYDKNGISRIRAHKREKYGDDLTLFRPSVKKIIDKPNSTAFFENGVAGLLFRVVEPIYGKNELLGFIEVGIDPKVFIQKIKQFNNLESYIFLKKANFSHIDKISYNTNQVIEFSDYRLFSKSNVDKTILPLIPKGYNLKDDKKFKIQNKILMAHTTSILDINNNKLGMFLSFQDISKTEDEYKNFLLVSILLSIITLIIILYILNKSFSKLTKQLEKYLTTLDKINDSIFVIDLSTHNIIFTNENAQKTLGYTKKEMLNLRLEQFSMPLNIEEKLIYDEIIENIKHSKQSFIQRAYNRAKDGSITPVEISFSYVNINDNEYLVSICHNIEKQLENELKSKANEKMINQYIPISQTDLAGNITYVNEAFCSLLGYSKDELLGKNHRIFKHPDTKEELYKTLWDKITNNEPWSGTLRNITKDESVIWANVRIEPIFNHYNKKIGYISTRDDITDKKELEYMR